MIYNSWIKYGLINIQDFCTGNSIIYNTITQAKHPHFQSTSKKKVNLKGEKKENYHKLKNQDCMDYVKNSNQNEICVNKSIKGFKRVQSGENTTLPGKICETNLTFNLHNLPPVLHLCESFSHLFFGPGLKVIFKKCKPEKLLPLFKP